MFARYYYEYYFFCEHSTVLALLTLLTHLPLLTLHPPSLQGCNQLFATRKMRCRSISVALANQENAMCHRLGTIRSVGTAVLVMLIATPCSYTCDLGHEGAGI